MSNRPIIWLGRLTTPRQLRVAAGALVAGAAAWLLLMLVLPAMLLAAIAFATRGGDGQIVWEPTWENLRRLAGFGALGWSADVLRIFWRSAWVAALVTAASVGLAYPLAFAIAARGPGLRRVLLALVVAAMCTSLAVRVYGWELLLSPGAPPAQLAQWLGLVDEGRGLYPSLLAVIVGMVSASLPFAFLPIYTSVTRLDWSQVDAARDLYASGWRLFRAAILPQTLPAATVAVILTFVPAMGMFVVSDRLGGAKVMLVGNLIQQQFSVSRDFPFGSAVSMVLVVLTLAGLWMYRRRVH